MAADVDHGSGHRVCGPQGAQGRRRVRVLDVVQVTHRGRDVRVAHHRLDVGDREPPGGLRTEAVAQVVKSGSRAASRAQRRPGNAGTSSSRTSAPPAARGARTRARRRACRCSTARARLGCCPTSGPTARGAASCRPTSQRRTGSVSPQRTSRPAPRQAAPTGNARRSTRTQRTAVTGLHGRLAPMEQALFIRGQHPHQLAVATHPANSPQG